MQNVTMLDIWTYRDRSDLGSNVVDTHADISGFGVEAVDGSIGKVDAATYDVGRSYIVVDTGPWIFGKKVLLPAGVVRGIDETERRSSSTGRRSRSRALLSSTSRLPRTTCFAGISGRTTGPVGPATATGTTRCSRRAARRDRLRRPGSPPHTRPPGPRISLFRDRYTCTGRRTVRRSMIPSPSPSVKNARAKGDAFVRASTSFQSTCSRTDRATSRMAR